MAAKWTVESQKSSLGSVFSTTTHCDPCLGSADRVSSLDLCYPVACRARSFRLVVSRGFGCSFNPASAFFLYVLRPPELLDPFLDDIEVLGEPVLLYGLASECLRSLSCLTGCRGEPDGPKLACR